MWKLCIKVVRSNISWFICSNGTMLTPSQLTRTELKCVCLDGCLVASRSQVFLLKAIRFYLSGLSSAFHVLKSCLSLLCFSVYAWVSECVRVHECVRACVRVCVRALCWKLWSVSQSWFWVKLHCKLLLIMEKNPLQSWTRLNLNPRNDSATTRGRQVYLYSTFHTQC